MRVRSPFAAPLVISVIGLTLLVSAPVWAQSVYSYNYSVGAFTLSGQLTTNAASGTITKTNVLTNSYTVFKSGVKQYAIAFPAGATNMGTLTNFVGTGAASGTYAGDDDFSYTIGSSHFNQANPSSVVADVPLDFTVVTAPNVYYGLAYLTSLNLFSLDQNSNVGVPGPQGTAGFASGPTVTPEPGSIAILVGMSVTGAGFLIRRRRK